MASETRMQTYRRNPDVTTTDVDADLFVVVGESQSIFHLNPTARGIWNLLEASTDLAEIQALFAQAFPGVDDINQAVETALTDMVASGIVLQSQNVIQNSDQ